MATTTQTKAPSVAELQATYEAAAAAAAAAPKDAKLAAAAESASNALVLAQIAELESEAAESIAAEGGTGTRPGRNGAQFPIPMSPLLAAQCAKYRLEVTVSAHGSRGYGQPKEGPFPVLTGAAKAIVANLLPIGTAVPLERLLPAVMKGWEIKEIQPADRFAAIVKRLARVSERRVVWNRNGEIRLSDTTDSGTKG